MFVTRTRLRSRLGLALILTTGIALLGGCSAVGSKVQTEPFRDFSVSLETLREEADRALGFNADWSYERFLDEMSLDESRATAEASVQSLLLERDGEDLFSVASFDAPLFLETENFRQGVYELNTAYLEYAQLLAALASASVRSSEEFERAATAIDADLQMATTLLDLGAEADRPRGILTTLAVEGLRLFIEKRRKEDLVTALNANQDNIATYAGEAQIAIETAARQLWQEYHQRSEELGATIATSTTTASRRRKALNDLVVLDRQFEKQLAALRSLNSAYGALPEAHGELAAAIGNPASTREAIRELYSEARRLKRLYESAVERESLPLNEE